MPAAWTSPYLFYPQRTLIISSCYHLACLVSKGYLLLSFFSLPLLLPFLTSRVCSLTYSFPHDRPISPVCPSVCPSHPSLALDSRSRVPLVYIYGVLVMKSAGHLHQPDSSGECLCVCVCSCVSVCVCVFLCDLVC